jgi:hypothetical protein
LRDMGYLFRPQDLPQLWAALNSKGRIEVYGLCPEGHGGDSTVIMGLMIGSAIALCAGCDSPIPEA